VSLNGTYNVNATTVFAHHIYDFVDTNVGYQFVPVLHRCEGKVRVDQHLINDVIEQNGGGGEDLGLSAKNQYHGVSTQIFPYLFDF
jgi:hypothetical protein